MTRVNPEDITHRRVLKIALPIVISNVTIPLIGIVDTGVIGQLGLAAPIGAVGLGSIIITAVYGLFGFLRMGTSGIASQERGRSNEKELTLILVRVLLIGFLLGLLVIAVRWPILEVALRLSPASLEVENLATQYVNWRILSAPAAIAIFGITGWLIALERTRDVLVLQILMNGLNVVLDFTFVLGLDLGVQGVALATLISEWAALILAIFLCRKSLLYGPWLKFSEIFNKSPLKRMLTVNNDIMIRSLLLEAAILSFIFLSSDFGDVTLASNQILIQFVFVSAFGLDGFAFASEALVGLSIGARTQKAVRRSSLLTSFWGFIVALSLSLVFYLFGNQLINMMTSEIAVRAVAKSYLWWIILIPVIGFPSWMLDGIFIGATRTRDMRNGMIISSIIYLITIIVMRPWLDNHGLWLALHVLFIARAVSLGIKYMDLELMARR